MITLGQKRNRSVCFGKTDFKNTFLTFDPKVKKWIKRLFVYVPIDGFVVKQSYNIVIGHELIEMSVPSELNRAPYTF